MEKALSVSVKSRYEDFWIVISLYQHDDEAGIEDIPPDVKDFEDTVLKQGTIELLVQMGCMLN